MPLICLGKFGIGALALVHPTFVNSVVCSPFITALCLMLVKYADQRDLPMHTEVVRRCHQSQLHRPKHRPFDCDTSFDEELCLG